ncbi:hypothetical protein [Bacteroides togonis]|uniref:hypothetical protein n=1 Tax=Bacteroides togonis TaxID=1917883 RepID=UPI0029370995|nr:hypothetical protein [Bacteroides togonis]
MDKLKDLQTSVDGLKTSIDEAKAAAEQAKKDAADALAKAQEALDAAGGGDEALKEQVAKLEKAVEEQAQKIAKLEELSVKVTELESKIDNAATKEELAALKEEFTKLSAQFMNIVGGRLTSTTLIPEFHINGIPAITFTTLQYTPQVYVKNEHKGNLADGTTKHATKPWLDHENVKGAKALYISTELNEANYQMNPNMGVTKDDVEMPSFDCIKSTNITTKAVDVANNKPIEVTGYDIKDGIMTVTFKKNKEFLGTVIGTDDKDKKETFYMASLKTPIAEANLTEEEKEKGEEVAVNSEYSRIEEIVAIPYLANSKTDFTKPINDDFADETQGTGDNLFYVHYHDSICLYNSGNDQLVDVRAQYNEPLDLSKLVTVCVSSDEKSHANHSELENYADYGLEFRFAMASAKYLQGGLKTDEQAFGKILNGHYLKSEVYDVELGDDEYSKTSIGREPIVRVSLVDTKNNNLVAQRYIKVRWTGEKEQTIDAYTFAQDTVTCKHMFQQMFSQAMNENVYHKIKFDGGQSISKKQFHDIYKSLKINELRKDGQKVDLSKYGISTDATKWEEGASWIKKDGDEQINDANIDLLFAMLEDKEDNTSYNLVWAMQPEIVGELANVNGKYASTFEIDVEYVDESGLNGNIKQTFKQTIVAPTQKFAYQGTYWKDGKGEGVFNVNPIVFNTSIDGWLGGAENIPHIYPGLTGGCELKDYSHIEADLVNGYIYEPTKQKPTSLAQFIQYIRNCAEVKFVFDADRFKDYDYLAGYKTDGTQTQLWKTTVGTPVDVNHDAPNPNIGMDDKDIWDYVQPDKNLAATINNFMSATTTENQKNLPWDYKEALGGVELDQCSAIIRLHEKDALNGTDAAKELIGRAVPVKLLVKYNDYNTIAVQNFEVFFINPLAIDGAIGDSFVDAEVDGSFLNVAKNFKFTDWNGYKVASAGIKDADKTETDKDDYAHQLYDYYAVKEVTFLTDKTTTSLAWDAATSTYIHKDGVKDGVLPTGRSLKMMNWVETDPKSKAEEVSSDPTHLAYFNNAGTPVNVDYFLYIDVNVQYKWGTLSKNDLQVRVSKAGGTPSGE